MRCWSRWLLAAATAADRHRQAAGAGSCSCTPLAPASSRRNTITYSTTATRRLDNIVLNSDPSPLGAWFARVLRRLMSHSASTRTQRDRVREMAEVRALADSVRQSDPGFAADLFAAADRYENLGR